MYAKERLGRIVANAQILLISDFIETSRKTIDVALLAGGIIRFVPPEIAMLRGTPPLPWESSTIALFFPADPKLCGSLTLHGKDRYAPITNGNETSSHFATDFMQSFYDKLKG